MLDEMLKIELFYEESLSLWLTENSSWVKKEDSKSKIGCKPLEEFEGLRVVSKRRSMVFDMFTMWSPIVGDFFSLSL